MNTWDEERTPFQITSGSEAYDTIQSLPVTVLLENLRSLHNVGSFFRTADAARIEALVLGGFTGTPPRKEIVKTALGAEEVVRWEHAPDPLEALLKLRSRGYEIAVIETGIHAIDVFDWQPRFPVCIAFGNELDGLTPELVAAADTQIRLPMLGLKHSLNVAVAGGIVIYELLRKYRQLVTYERLPR